MNTKPKIFHGWYIVACGFLSQGMRVGLGAQTFGFFFKPMIEELGWNRTVMTAALLVRDLVSSGVYPAFGYAVDRCGPRFLMAGSAVVLGISLMLLSQTREIWQFILFYGVIGTFGVPGLGYGVVSPTIAKWFIRHRGRGNRHCNRRLECGCGGVDAPDIVPDPGIWMAGSLVLSRFRSLDRRCAALSTLASQAAGRHGFIARRGHPLGCARSG